MNGKKVHLSGNNFIAVRYLIDLFPFIFKRIKFSKNGIYFFLKKNIYFFLEVLKYHFQFFQLIDLFALDYLSRAKRFDLYYGFLNLFFDSRIFIIFNLTDFQGIFSLKNLFLSSIWLEREVWDMNGILFFNNPDLRRILTDYGFLGHPLRKDFPLSGFFEIFYDDEQKAILSIDMEHSQEYRLQGNINPWGITIDY
jgi:NADH:ubiquinone oxidoreductase subunit C